HNVEYREKVIEILSDINNWLVKIAKEESDGPEKIAINKIIDNISKHETALLSYAGNLVVLDKLSDGMRDSARDVDDAFDMHRQKAKKELYGLLNQERNIYQSSAHSLIDRADDSNRLIKYMLEARRAEKNYVISKNIEYITEINEIVSKMKKLTSSTFSGEDESALIKLISYYSVSFNQYVEVQRKSEKDGLLLAKNTIEIEDLAEALRVQAQINLDESGDQMVLMNFSIATLAVLFGGGISYLMSRSIVLPLSNCVDGIQKIADGDLDVSLSTERKDELGILANATSDMAKRLRDMIGGMKDNISYIATSSEELSALTNETSNGVVAQQQDIEQVATAMTEMSASAHEVALKAENTLQSANLAYEEAKKGNNLVIATVTGMNELAEAINASEQVIQSVRVDSENIVSILDVIKNISDQTNLLALNAAIEAARAGDHGRGFAVVADEVRSLAQKTQNSTVEIEKMIDNLKSGAESAVDKMVESKTQVSAMVIQTEEVNNSLTSISTEIGQITDMSAQAHQAVTEQGTVAEEVSTRMNTIQGVVEQTSLASQQTEEAGKELARIGEDLRALSDTFILKS
ncbi:methyl-accepting chemotaxis protein, partial [Vibrio sp. LaRot3]|uniref:methyl-accepting chemotaxis protein n=1 Tax=Vibrio sp. LaRot3 TaxID=2998829 RepID=UPI0022CDE091